MLINFSFSFCMQSEIKRELEQVLYGSRSRKCGIAENKASSELGTPNITMLSEPETVA